MYYFMFIGCLNTIASRINTNPFFRCFRLLDDYCRRIVEEEVEKVNEQRYQVEKAGGGESALTIDSLLRNAGDASPLRQPHQVAAAAAAAVQVKYVFIVHVGGTRCVTSSTDHSMTIHVRITLTVEVIRTCIFVFLFDV